MSDWQLGIDIGGTFTDVVASNPATGEVRSGKVPSHYNDPITALVGAIGAVGLTWEDVEDLTHGTTMVTNAIVENRIDEVALVSTMGFGDTIAIGRVRRKHIYHMDRLPKQPPLVPADRRFEVAERIDHMGGVVCPLTEDEIARVVAQVKASGVRAVAVCLLHGYRNSIHELQLGRALQEVVEHVCLSHEISPEIREYERSNTTILSAAVIGRVDSYLKRIDAQKPASSNLTFFHSAGGMAATPIIAQQPLLLAMSGPAAGVSATVATMKTLGIDRALTFDMGGTTTDCCLVLDGRAEISSDRELGERRIRMPMVSVHSIGAGGGSIARIDQGVMQVGPRSAGAQPGPACYGRGGTEPTVSDANILMGYLAPNKVLGNAIRLDHDLAKAAVAPIAADVGVTVEEAAAGILQVAHSNMARALNKVTVERGVDGRDCTLIAYGGGGPMHAAFVARHYGIRNVVCPAFSSSYSAHGCVASQMSLSQQRTVNMSSDAWDAAAIAQIRDELAEAVTGPIREAGKNLGACDISEVALLRYRGQSHEVPVADPALDDPQALGRQFKAMHEALFGFATDEEWELSAVRTTAEDSHRKVIAAPGQESGSVTATSSRPCHFPGVGAVETQVLNRAALPAGEVMDGPAIVEDDWSTIVIPPGDRFHADRHGHVHIEVREE
ncbi:probable hydantoin utilization protein [Pseudooceanicola batsensis HTCC2597]|uniref:Probable hydantoin utilization protein n=1 Tax=Pseudooceanicola batsensis (strain ATCC BAA-863 / DSM 15984 / KCTC 12145 / HTCC2597) TaxID=252305 RepID=A3U088_PSEBH|nr:hydantoinase/oxoprolinase family protein [Pseudooceanicola batsensis]EAQ02179.1 probable hydantoin utilization protein [Pseudooceanicola batsensis HTCC2597]